MWIKIDFIIMLKKMYSCCFLLQLSIITSVFNLLARWLSIDIIANSIIRDSLIMLPYHNNAMSQDVYIILALQNNISIRYVFIFTKFTVKLFYFYVPLKKKSRGYLLIFLFFLSSQQHSLYQIQLTAIVYKLNDI